MKRLVLLACIWGWSFLLIKVAVGGMTPTTVATARVGLGALVLLVVLRLRGLRLPSERSWWRHFLVVAVAGSAMPFTLLAWGEQHVSSALTAVLNASTPLFAAILAGVLLGDRLRRVQGAGLVIGFVGVAVAAGVGGSDLAASSIGGEAASVLAGAGYAFSFTYTRRHLISIPPLVAAAGQLVTATLLLLPFAVVTTARQGIDLNGRRLLAVALLGVLGTGLAYVLSYRLVADVGPTRASLVTYLIPVVAVTVGVVFLDEPFVFRLVLGGLLTVVGVALTNLGGRVVSPPAPVPVPTPRG